MAIIPSKHRSTVLQQDRVKDILFLAQRCATETCGLDLSFKDSSSDCFSQNVAKASKAIVAKDMRFKLRLLRASKSSPMALFPILAVNFSRLSDVFGPNLSIKFLSSRQKLLLSSIASLVYLSVMAKSANQVQHWFAQARSPLTFESAFSKLTEGFHVLSSQGHVESALWEVAGQVVNVTQLAIKATGTLARNLGFLGIGLVALEGAALQYQIENKRKALFDKKAKLEGLDSPGADADLSDLHSIERQEGQQEVDTLEQELSTLEVRRQYVMASFVFALTAVVLASVFTAGIAPLAIGLAAALVSLSITIAECCLVKEPVQAGLSSQSSDSITLK